MEANVEKSKTSKFILLDNLFMKKNAKDFYDSREIICRALYVLSMFVYFTVWSFNVPSETPAISIIVAFILSPIFVFSFNYRANTFLFRNNLLHIAYYCFSLSIYILTLYHISKLGGFHGYVPVGYEVGQIIIASGVGYLVPVFVSFPFKIVHLLLFGSLAFYYHERQLEAFEHAVYPEKAVEKQEQRNKVAKTKMKYEGLNETLLNVELGLALKDERFEDAAEIRAILEKRFGH